MGLQLILGGIVMAAFVIIVAAAAGVFWLLWHTGKLIYRKK